jgi:hypothetical protein
VSAFDLYPRLASNLQAANEQGSQLYALVVPDAPILDDLSALPADATFVATRGTAARLDRLGATLGLVAVWANPASDELIRVLAGLPRLRAVYLTHVKRIDLSPLATSSSLEHILVGWAPALTDLSFLARIPTLRTLYLENVGRLDLDTLPSLPRLTALHIGGGMWSALKAASLKPLARLSSLAYLTLANVRPMDGSLAPLAGLRQLRELRLPNFFSVEECARLAAALPDTAGNILRPIFIEPSTDGQSNGLLPCVACGGSRAMMTGRPAATLCPACDAGRIAKRVARWEMARVDPPGGSDHFSS